MKYNKGFIGTGMIVAIIAVLVIGGGVVYIYTKSQPKPTSYLNASLVKTYSVLSDESNWIHDLVSSENPESWFIPAKNITVKAINYQNNFTCADRPVKLIKYSSYNSGAVGGWDSVSIVDCQDYYFVFKYGDSGPKLFGPFDQNQNSTTPTNAQNQNSNSSSVPISTPTITVSSPNGGETLKAGGTYKIKWQTSSAFSSDYPKVSITLVGGSRDQAITPDQTIIANNTGSYDWTIPNVQLSTYIQDVSGGSYTLKNISGQKQFKFLITGYPQKSTRAEGPLDYSDNYFTVTSPSVSTLKTYQNSTYGFEFKYPSKWQECSTETLQNFRIKNENAKLAICISDPSTKDDFHKILTFYVDQSGQYTFASLRQYLQSESKKATDLGLYSYFEDKKIGGRQYLHSGAGDVGTWGTYYTLLDAKTEQKTFLVIKYSNAIPELETILSSSLKMKEDGLSF